jgi:ribosomal-protein-alanine N-acetyltransferase
LIRKAIKEDIGEINKLGNLLHSNFDKLFHLESEINNPNAILLVCLDSQQIKGYLYALDFGDNIDLLSIIVSPLFRRKGMAYEMFKYLVDNYCYQDKTITLEVALNNKPAMEFYEKVGFKVVNVRKKYYKDSDAYIMKWGIKE